MRTEEKYSSLEEHVPPLFISQKAALVRATLHWFSDEKQEVMVKCYKPELYPEFTTVLRDLPPVVMEGGYKRSPDYYFKKEAQVLFTLSQYTNDTKTTPLCPHHYNTLLRDRKIVMEYIDAPRFVDKFLELKEGEEDKKNRLLERLLQGIAFFQFTINNPPVWDNFHKLTYGRRQKLVDFRTSEEETARLRHYIRLIVFNYSSEFRDDYGVEGWSYTPDGWKIMKTNIRQFLGEKGIFFDEFVDTLLNRHRQILYGEANPYNRKSDRKKLIEEGRITLIHGDPGPQNVFYQLSGKGNFIDFNELRLSNRHIDVVRALYHVTSDPSELAVLKLLYNYYTDELKGNSDSFTSEFLPQVVATRLMEDFCWIASDSRKSRSELRLYSGLVKARNVSTDTLRRYNLERHIVFSEFYLRGEGRDVLIGPREEQQLLLAQLGDFERFLRTAVDPADSSYTRKVFSLQQRYEEQQVVNGGKK